MEHDGYCSEPGDDVGEWEYGVEEIYYMSDEIYQGFLKYINYEGYLDLDFLKKMFDSQELGCGGSGYCGYDGTIKVNSGRIVKVD